MGWVEDELSKRRAMVAAVKDDAAALESLKSAKRENIHPSGASC